MPLIPLLAIRRVLIAMGTMAEITAAQPNVAQAIVANKVAVHEIGHQFLKPGGGIPGTDINGHRGLPGHIAIYLGLADAEKLNPTFLNVLNVMNKDAAAVPMNNPATRPMDWFIFHPLDIDEIRRLGKL